MICYIIVDSRKNKNFYFYKDGIMSKRRPISLEVKLRVVKRCLRNEKNPSYEAKYNAPHCQDTIF
ncbi:hypothetical protein ERIC2_c03710 [Paenibacillus larvae subsp. larvae DSM 25430]|uniref:Uncharacterized protein n=1 Tax=Paenibacillus larvae subsp. larvae DSM 25430 TaxID=697284 RepID=V9W3M7_9BACL|nr:hypothetical protein ERIC2_c03710 [Paenibacillus larvae subsp. larvae DSM 25430]